MNITASRAAIVLFCGNPQREERQKQLPRRFLSVLHRALLRTLRGIDGDVLVAGEIIGGSRRGASLAGQVEAAVRFCFDAGYARVLLLAGDVIDVRRCDITRALELLEAAAPLAVIGPSGDGGFHLAGFNTRPSVAWEHLFDDRSRSRDELEAALLDRGYAIESIRRADDVDDRRDAERIVCELTGALAGMLRGTLATCVVPVPARQTFVAAFFHVACGSRAPPLSRCA